MFVTHRWCASRPKPPPPTSFSTTVAPAAMAHPYHQGSAQSPRHPKRLCLPSPVSLRHARMSPDYPAVTRDRAAAAGRLSFVSRQTPHVVLPQWGSAEVREASGEGTPPGRFPGADSATRQDSRGKWKRCYRGVSVPGTRPRRSSWWAIYTKVRASIWAWRWVIQCDRRVGSSSG
jgi:hypothetical protein